MKLKCKRKKKKKKEHSSKKIYLHHLDLSKAYSQPLSSIIHSFLPPPFSAGWKIDF